MSTSPCPDEPGLWPLVTGDPAPEEVRDHIASCIRCQSVILRLRRDIAAMRSSHAGSEAAYAPGESESPAALAPADQSAHFDAMRSSDTDYDGLPESIGRYPVRGLIRCSGQAAVYLGRHRKLGIDVVIKWAHTCRAAPEGPDALIREARLLARIHHPNLARVLDAGVAEGRTYLVLEYIRGTDLRQAMTKCAVPADEVCRIMGRVAAAVAAVHRHGILHLDIKPENIILGDDGEPRLIDLGSAQMFDALTGRVPAAATSGSPDYMAPERRVGATPTECSDVFSLGAVLQELLTGTHQPVESNSARGGLRASRCLPDIASRRIDDLLQICACAMHVDPLQRTASASDFSAQLQRWMDHRARRRRPIRAAAASGASLIAVALGIGLSERTVRSNAANALTNEAPRLELHFADGAEPGRATVTAECRSPAACELALYFVFPDGRLLPLAPIAIERRGDAQIARVPYNAHPLALSARRETAMIIAAIGPPQLGDTLPVSLDCGALPALPAGTILRDSSDSREAGQPSEMGPSISAPVRRRIAALHDCLHRTFDRFEAVLFTPSAQH